MTNEQIARTDDADLAARTDRATVARLDELPVDSMKMVSVGETKVALVRTAHGVHAIDNACPHQGYGLTTGSLAADGVLTCQWHNWKFDVTDGRCLLGEEDVACHRVDIDDGEISVEVVKPTAAETRDRLWPSLRRGLADDYVGQVARDSVRLLEAGASPGAIMAEALRAAAPKADYGVGHEMAMAADCLALAEIRTGDDRALALVQGLSGLAEETRDRPVTPLPEGDAGRDLEAAIEAEDVEGAMASIVGQLAAGVELAELRHQLLRAVSNHHLSYGHGIIYTQKTFELLDRLGADRALDLLPYLAERITYSTREDQLPYMRKAQRAIEAVDLDALVAAPADGRPIEPAVIDALLAADQAPIEAAVELVLGGAGIDGLLSALSLAVSHRLLNHDLDVELDLEDIFGWLDITHGLTTARAVRWAWEVDPGPHVARLALYATWLLFDTGRSERRRDNLATVAALPAAEAAEGDIGRELTMAIRRRNPETAVALALGGPREDVGGALAEAALQDGAGSFLVVAHLIKTAQAARDEADHIESSVPLAAAARFLAAPRLERFVARNVIESVDFVRTGRPPRR